MRGFQTAKALRFQLFLAFTALLVGSRIPAQVTLILETHNDSVTTYKPSGNTAVQGVRPLHLQRGVNLDGSLRSGPSLPIALAGNPFENVWRGQQYQGSLRVDVGTYAPLDVDIALPAKGFSWVIGRTYNSRQETSGGSATDSNGYQGYNWFQASQPELVFYDDNDNAKDMVYLVYGADRYIEFLSVRTTSPYNQWKAKNGAAGCLDFTSGGASADTFTYTDQVGNQIVFFGFDGDAGAAAGQIWKLTDPDANTAYVGHATTSATAITNGYDGSGRILKAYDTSDRRFTYTYTSVDSVSRLTQVKAETKSGGTWDSPTGLATVGQVDYGYYATGDSDIANGSSGDLKKVTITDYLDDSVTLTKKRYYRYWKGTYNSSTNPGYPHALWYAFDFEGVRAYDWTDSTFDEDFLAGSESSLKPYAAAYFEYDSAHKVRKAWFNGECGCSGASNGVYEYTYETVSYSSTSGYDNAHALRTLIKRPDASYETRYFDETGQGMAVVTTDIIPSGAYTKIWATRIQRDSGGVVTYVHSPDNMDTYTHSTGAVTSKTAAGLVRHLVRLTTGNMTGFLSEQKFLTGTSGSEYYEQKLTWSSATKSITDVTVVRPYVSAKRLYHTAGTTDTSANYDETSFAWTFYSSPAQITVEKIDTTWPTVATGNNGSGSATSRSAHYRKDGLVDYEKDEGGIITYHDYTAGRETTTREDADTGDLPEPTGFTSSGTALNRTTDRSYSVQGRIQKEAPPGNANKKLHTRLADHHLVLLEYADYDPPSSEKFYGPVRYTVLNQAGKAEVRATVKLTSNETATATSGHIDETDSDPITAADLGTLAQMTIFLYSEDGHTLEEERTYFSIPSSGAGTDGTHYDPTKYAYDDSGRRIRTKEACSTIRRASYDVLGRVTAHAIGTNDYGLAGGESSGTSNMVTTELLEYDGDADKGNSNLTKRTLRVQSGTTDQRVTEHLFDVRGRAIVDLNPTAPYALHKFDNRGRHVATGLYSSSSGLDASDDPTSLATNRLALSQTFFDEKGQVWKTQRHKIDDADGSDDDNLQTLSWYDASGQLIKTDGSDLKKTKYDRIGRVTDEYVLAVDNDSAYGDADDVGGDIVLEERQTRFDSTTGIAILQARIDRFHSDIDTGSGETTGELDTNADSLPLKYTATNVKGRIQISAMWYDRFERLEDRVEYGTYGGSDFDRSGLSVPARSDTALRTTNAYNTDGTLDMVTDPKALVFKRTYDAEGRVLTEVRNYVNGTPGTGNDDDVTVAYAYTDGLRVSLTADLPSGQTDQVTTYIYGSTKDTPSQMRIATGHLLRAIKYPDSTNNGTTVANIDSDSSDVVSFAYNAQGQEVYKKDQGGNIVETDCDTSGRPTQKRVTTLGSGFDGAIRRIATTFDSLGRSSEIVQYDNATVGSGTAQDGVKYTWHDWGVLDTYEEDRNGAVASDQYSTSYAWEKATTGRNTLRKTSATLPGGRAITHQYRASGGLHDSQASRVTAVLDGAATLCWYDYNGVGQVVRQKYNQASVMWQEWSSTPGTYPDLDRFNRVVASRWTKDLATDVDFYSVALTYDRNSNITSADDSVHAGFDVKYTMDSVDRLTQAEEGTLSGGSITSKTRDELWTLNHTGNWDENKVNLNGDADFTDSGELDEDRTHDAVNQLNARDTDDNGTDNYTLTYDGPGDLTDDGKDYEYEYDAFLRLRKVKNTSNQALVAEFKYNGLGHRIAVHEDTDTDGDVDSNDKWYYDAYDERWRQVARFRESDSSPKEDFVPHQAGLDGVGDSSYIDLVVCRNKDANTAWTSTSDGTLEERRFYCQNWRADVSGLVNADGSLLIQWDKYSAYGIPFGLPGGDTDSDGDCDSTDVTQVQTWIDGSTYDTRGDIDLDGDVDATDKSTLQTSFVGITLGRALLTSGSVQLARGYAGYLHDALPGPLLHVRNRMLGVAAGRWCQRDSLEEHSWPNSYQYAHSQPHIGTDPLGQSCNGCTLNPYSTAARPFAGLRSSCALVSSYWGPPTQGWCYGEDPNCTVVYPCGVSVTIVYTCACPNGCAVKGSSATMTSGTVKSETKFLKGTCGDSVSSTFGIGGAGGNVAMLGITVVCRPCRVTWYIWPGSQVFSDPE